MRLTRHEHWYCLLRFVCLEWTRLISTNMTLTVRVKTSKQLQVYYLNTCCVLAVWMAVFMYTWNVCLISYCVIGILKKWALGGSLTKVFWDASVYFDGVFILWNNGLASKYRCAKGLLIMIINLLFAHSSVSIWNGMMDSMSEMSRRVESVPICMGIIYLITELMRFLDLSLGCMETVFYPLGSHLHVKS